MPRPRRGRRAGGESDSGKSTLARLVAGLRAPAAGIAEVLGADLKALSRQGLREPRKCIGFVFHDPASSLDPLLTVGDCIAEPLHVLPLLERGACGFRTGTRPATRSDLSARTEDGLGEGSTVVNVGSATAARRSGVGCLQRVESGTGRVLEGGCGGAGAAGRVNVVSPGALDTRMPQRLLDGRPDKEAVMAVMVETAMLKRVGQVYEVVPLCLFPASEEATLITGATIPVDGGMSAR
ncbi:SDR family oxidoreductase [Amycolatopsis thermoflava]